MHDGDVSPHGVPRPPPPQGAAGRGGGGRKWNTPSELHQLLYVIAGRGADGDGFHHHHHGRSGGHAEANGKMPALVQRESNLKDLKQRRTESKRAQVDPAASLATSSFTEGGSTPRTSAGTPPSHPKSTKRAFPAAAAAAAGDAAAGDGYRFCGMPPSQLKGPSPAAGPLGGRQDSEESLVMTPRGRRREKRAPRVAGEEPAPPPVMGPAAPVSPSAMNRAHALSMGSRMSTQSMGSGIVTRVSSTLSMGHGVGLYTGDDLTFHGPGVDDDAGMPCEIRITGSLFVVHQRAEVEDNAAPAPAGRQSFRPKLHWKAPLINIATANMDHIANALRIAVVLTDCAGPPAVTSPQMPGVECRSPTKWDASGAAVAASRASDATSTSAAVNVLVTSSSDEQLEELLHCLLHQQTKAFQAELGRLRKSLRPQGTKTLDIVHFNDVYHLNVHKKEEPCGGLTRFFHALEEIRRKKNPLVLFSGDFVGPSLMSVCTKGKQMIDALNFIGTHYGVFGNHEFDFGLRNLERIVHGYTQGEYIFCGSTTTWVMTNMDGRNGLPLGNVERKKLLQWNGVTIGILGLCENWLPHCPRLQKDEASYRDIFEVGEQEARELKEEGAQLVIALTHNRLAMDKSVTKRCPSIDLLLGGHDHFYKKDIESRVIKSGEEFQWLSEVQVHIPDEDAAEGEISVQCRTHPISSDLPENEMVNKLVQRYGEKMSERMGKNIGRTTVPFDSTEEACRFREGALTNFLADLMQDETDADCAVLGGAAVAGKVLQDAGLVTIGDVFNWFPDEIKVQVVEMSGHWLEHMLNFSVAECPNEAPSFPHPSNNLTYTLSVIGTPKVTEIMIKGEPLNREKQYSIAVTDFVAAGKERFKFVKEHCKVLTDSEHAEQFSMWVLEYFRRRQIKAEQTPGGGDKERGESAVNPQQAQANPKLRRRLSSFNCKPTDDLKEGFELMDDDLQDLEEDTMRGLMKSLMNVSEETSPQHTQTAIKAAVKKLLGCDRATIFLVDPVRQQLRFLPDGASTEVRIPIEAGIAGSCAKTGEVMNIPDAYEDPRFNQDIDRQTGYHTHNILACPVKRRDGSVVAVMQAVNKKDKQDFTKTDAKILNLFGKQTAITLGHAEVFASLKKNQEATNTLLKVARDIASDVAMDMKTMIACIMSGSSQLLQSDRSSLFLVDSAAQEMWTIIIDPATGGETIVRLPVGTGLAGHTAVSGQLLNLFDAYDSPLFNSEFDKKSGYRTKQVLCVPIFTGEESSDVLGVLQFINKIDGTDFSKQDEATAEAFASFAGISIANTQEIDLLKLKSDDKQFLEIPPPSMGRIRVKGGWSTVRRVLMDPQSRITFKEMMQKMDTGLSEASKPMSLRIKRLMNLNELKENDVASAAAAGSLPGPIATTRAKLMSVRLFRDSIRQRAVQHVTASRRPGDDESLAGSRRGSLRPGGDASPVSRVSGGGEAQWAFAGSPVQSEIIAPHGTMSPLGTMMRGASRRVSLICDAIDNASDNSSNVEASPRHRIPERRGSRHGI